jgi:hypothetical protein
MPLDTWHSYKPTKAGTGAASGWQLSRKEGVPSLWFQMAKQAGNNAKGNATFDWEHKIIFKLGQNDVGEILAVLMRQKDGVGEKKPDGKHSDLFHQTEKGNTVLYFGVSDKGGFQIALSRKMKGEAAATRIMHALTVGEAAYLLCLLHAAVPQLHGWTSDTYQSGRNEG